MRRLVMALIACGLALSCGSLAVIVATVWLTPERPRPATPTAIVALAPRATGTPRGEGPRLFTPTAVPAAPAYSPTPAPPTPTRASPTAALSTATSPATGGAPPTPSPAATPARLPPTATASPPPPAAPTPRPAATPTRAAAPATPTIPPPAPTATATPRAAPLVLTVTHLTLEPGQQASVGVSYTERGQIAWTAFSDSNWLTVSPTSGTLQGETDILTIRAQRGDLAAGTHQGRVIVEAGGGQAVVRVTMRVPGP